MIDFKKVNFVKSATSLSDRPEKALPEVVFVGRSNVGKSTLLNSLVGRKSLAYTSSKPGYTKLLNYFEVDSKLYLVDAPGYGYTISGGKHLDSFAKMMESYFDNPNLKGVIFLVDSRHKLSNDDVDFFNFVKEKNIKFVLVATKADKLNQSEKAQTKKIIKSQLGEVDFMYMSNKDLGQVDELKKEISYLIKS